MPSALTRIHFSELWERQRGLCWICGVAMNRIKQKFGEHSHPNAATIDHAIPQADGGSDMRENLRLAHYRCNNERADPLPHDGWLDEHPALAAAASKPTAAGLIAAAIQRTRGQESEI